MRAKRVLLAIAVLAFAGALGAYGRLRYLHDFDCLATAERGHFSMEFHRDDGESMELDLTFDPGRVVASKRGVPRVDTAVSSIDARRMAREVLEPLRAPAMPDARPPRSDVTLRLTCDGGIEHRRELFTRPVWLRLHECVLDTPAGMTMRERADCAFDWLRQRRSSSWREHDDRAIEVVYQAWRLMLTLEQANETAVSASESPEAP